MSDLYFRTYPIGLAIMVGQIGHARHVIFVEPVTHFVLMVPAILIGYILNIACYYFKLL